MVYIVRPLLRGDHSLESWTLFKHVQARARDVWSSLNNMEHTFLNEILFKKEPQFIFQIRISQNLKAVNYSFKSHSQLLTKIVSIIVNSKICYSYWDVRIIPVIKSMTPFWIFRSSFKAFKLEIVKKNILHFVIHVSHEIYLILI